MTTTPIGGGWASYLKDIVPKDAGPVQVEECRRAFFSGAWTMYQLNITIGEPGVSDAKAAALLNAVAAEFKVFLRELQRMRGGDG